MTTILALCCLLGSIGLSTPRAAGGVIQLNNIRVTGITHRIVTVRWESNFTAASQVLYGPTDQYGQSASTPGMVTDHRVILAELDPDTTYHYRTVSLAADGQAISSPDRTFTTSSTPTPPTGLPADFPSPIDVTTGLPMPGLGGGPGVLYHHPVILVHGNNESARYWKGLSHAMARLFGNYVEPMPVPDSPEVRAANILERLIERGYTPAELWAPSYLGRDGVNNFSDFVGSSTGHSHAANTGDVGAFIEAVLDYTQADKVDVIAHSLGVTLVRNWIRSELDLGTDVLSKLDDVVFIAGPNHGVHYCGFPFVRGNEPASSLTLCEEVGRSDTPFLSTLNVDETPRGNEGPDYMTIFAAGEAEDAAYPADGVDSMNRQVNFRLSPVLAGAVNVGLSFSLEPDPRFPYIFPGDPPLILGDPRPHYLLGTSELSFEIYFPFVSNLRN